MSLNETIVSTLSVNNMKTIGEASAFLTAQAQQQFVAHQSRVNVLAEAGMAKAQELLLTTDIAESAGLVPLVQQLMKGAQTTPPVTP